ncbi:MAG: beta-lactamase family protein [Alphaproteobacteria bacterium]|nr:beta-lactamase family protein [Alphaproteobacteria bacterium]
MTNRIRVWLVVAAMFAVPAIADETLESQIDALAAKTMAEKHIPGLAIQVIHEGRVIFDKGYGLESVERNVPITTSSVLPIASVSKVFAGTVAMQLHAEGRMDLDASIQNWFLDAPDDKAVITPRHLLSHSHGIEDYYHSKKFEALPEEERAAMKTDDRVKLMWSLNQPLKTAPGETFSYSLVGYAMLTRIIEAVEGKAFAEVVAERVFKPLGLASAHYGGSSVIVPGRFPLTYEWKDGGLAYHHNDFPPATYTAGGLNISVADLGRYLTALQYGGFLEASLRDEMWASYPFAKEDDRFYGLGWFSYTRRKDGRFVVGHEGGGSSWLVNLPAEGLTIVALSNMSGARADALPHEISYLVLDALKD